MDFSAQWSLKLMPLGVIFVSFWENLDLLILATPSMRQPCFRGWEGVRICQFWMTFPEMVHKWPAETNFSDVCRFWCPKGTQLGLPKSEFFVFFGSSAQDGSQGVPGQAPRLQKLAKWSPQYWFLRTFGIPKIDFRNRFGIVFEYLSNRFGLCLDYVCNYIKYGLSITCESWIN